MRQVRPWPHHFLSLEHRTHVQYISPASFLMQHAMWLCRARAFFGVLSVMPQVLRYIDLKAGHALVLLSLHQIWGFRCEFRTCKLYMFCQYVLSANGLHAWSVRACCSWVLLLLISFLHLCNGPSPWHYMSTSYVGRLS